MPNKKVNYAMQVMNELRNRQKAIAGDFKSRAQKAEKILGEIEECAITVSALNESLSAVLTLARTGTTRPLSKCLESVDSAGGRQRLATYLACQPFPHYKPAPAAPGLLVRIEQDGTRTIGRFVNRKFHAVPTLKVR